ncbi:MAG TPA: ATP-binding protein [Alphaproteobacteria bacterium]|nr:ATP-binding protein [Alphaproteobacteria bacterium]
MKDNLLRNFLIFVVIACLMTGTMTWILIAGDRDVDTTSDLVSHTHIVLVKSEQVGSLVEGMLSEQRGYILTGEEEFLKRYESKKREAEEILASVRSLIADNSRQKARLTELTDSLEKFMEKLETRARTFKKSTIDPGFIQGIKTITAMRDDIVRVNDSILQEEYSILNQRIAKLERKKSDYLRMLVVGLSVGTAVLLLLNAFLFFAQQRRLKSERNLKTAEDRFAMVIEGTQDGIFDWDIVAGRVYFSRRYFGMLGYDRAGGDGTPQDFYALVHPDDMERVRDYIELYLAGGLSEYAVDFRMKGVSGRWIWIQSRGRAQFDPVSGKPVRMVGAHTDITHIKQAQVRLEQEKEEAQVANRAKSEFLAHMSHEIRTPLTAISGIAEILERKQQNLDDKQKQLVRTLVSSSSTLKDLINDVLDFSKIESGDVELHNEDFDLGEVFESVVSIMALRASEKGISFVFDYNEAKAVSFHGDKIRLRQILINLVANAIKFTERGGVTVKASFEDRNGKRWLRVAVNDTGIGIAPEHFDLVFERFRQADSSVSRKYGGTGLGLAISRRLARMMHGDIILSSQPGQGSTFTILLPPLSDVLSADGGEQNARGSLRQQTENNVALERNAEERRVLLVEDYEGNIVVIGYLLDDLGLSYDIARTGKQALDLWQARSYDVVLMDVQMPEMDGFTATREIRRLEQENGLPRTPVIGMTAHALVGDKDKCIEVGMDTYLPKPIVEEHFRQEILSHLRRPVSSEKAA